MPGETVSSLPVTRVPVTIGSTVAKGGLDTTSVDAVNRTTDPNEFVAVNEERMYLPKSISASTRVLEVAPLIGKQPEGAVLDAEATSESHLYH